MIAPSSTAPHALVVDDNFLIRMDAASILEQVGFQVLDTGDGDAAYKLLTTWHPAVVLLFTDVQMPGELDGFALARKVAQIWPHISLVVASGEVRPEIGSLPDKARFIAKPFSADVVHAHVREIVPPGYKPKALRRT